MMDDNNRNPPVPPAGCPATAEKTISLVPQAAIGSVAALCLSWDTSEPGLAKYAKFVQDLEPLSLVGERSLFIRAHMSQLRIWPTSSLTRMLSTRLLITRTTDLPNIGSTLMFLEYSPTYPLRK